MNESCYIEKFQEEYQFRLVPETMKNYQYSVKQLQEDMGKSYVTISKSDIRKWLIMLGEKGYKNSTILSKLVGLKTFYNYCLEEGIISVNPAVEIPYPKVEENSPKYLTESQMTRLRDLLEGNLLERALVEVLLTTGMRIGELCAMKKEDINWSERSIHIPEGKWKKDRIVCFSKNCEEHLQAFMASRSDDSPYVFVLPGYKNLYGSLVLHRFFYKYSEQLGFKVTPHMLRHTFTAHLAKKGMSLDSIRILLGHDSVQTTHIYSRLYSSARKDMYDHWM